jgi:DNA-binding response OmpR family regulator
MYNVLIVDFSLFKHAITKIFKDNGYHVDLCESAFDAMKMLKSTDYDLVVTEVELPGDNAFDLYRYLSLSYPHIPAIMTTEKDIDTFFDLIVQEGIGNVLCKPIKKEEVLNLAEKLITKKNIFGLGNYLENIRETKKIRITNSKQIKNAIRTIIDELKAWGFKIDNEIYLTLILDEMLINAVYHSHGLTDEKIRRVPVQLENEDFVDIFFAKSPDKYAIAIDDYKGKLSKMTILDTINKVIKQNKMLNDKSDADKSEFVQETGRGIDFVRRLAGEYYFIIEKEVRTEILIIFDSLFDNDTTGTHSSLKIIEKPASE